MLGVATNLDNLIIGLTIGWQGKRIPFLHNLCIALGSALAAYACCELASLFAGLGRAANALGGGLLIVLGIWPLIPKRKAKAEELDPAKAPRNAPGAPTGERIGWRETLLLSCALAANCLAASFGAGMTGLSSVSVAATIGAFSFACVALGNFLGRRRGARVNDRRVNAIASIVLILVGAMQIFA